MRARRRRAWTLDDQYELCKYEQYLPVISQQTVDELRRCLTTIDAIRRRPTSTVAGRELRAVYTPMQREITKVLDDLEIITAHRQDARAQASRLAAIVNNRRSRDEVLRDLCTQCE